MSDKTEVNLSGVKQSKSVWLVKVRLKRKSFHDGETDEWRVQIFVSRRGLLFIGWHREQREPAI